MADTAPARGRGFGRGGGKDGGRGGSRGRGNYRICIIEFIHPFRELTAVLRNSSCYGQVGQFQWPRGRLFPYDTSYKPHYVMHYEIWLSFVGRGRGRGRGRGKEAEKEWVPVTKLGRLVSSGKIKSLEEIYLFSLPIKEFEIVDFFIGPALNDEVLKIMPVQKQTRAGQRTRFKVCKYVDGNNWSTLLVGISLLIFIHFSQAFVAIGDSNGHIGLGVKCSKEVATAIRGAIILAKLSVVPVRRGYWGNKIGKPHTVPCKVNINYKSHCLMFRLNTYDDIITTPTMKYVIIN